MFLQRGPFRPGVLLVLLGCVGALTTSSASYADGYVGLGGPGVGVGVSAGVGPGVGGPGLSINFGAPCGGGLPTRNGLPPTCLDSFVYEAGGQAELIYGDEGTDGPPPYGLGSSALGGGGIGISAGGVSVNIGGIGVGSGGDGFDSSHRINAGISGIRDQGLTTGHGSYLPSAWGRDEFVGSGGSSPSGISIGIPGTSVSVGIPGFGAPGQSASGGEWSMSGPSNGGGDLGFGITGPAVSIGVAGASLSVGVPVESGF